jgi:hypothetical protein
MHWADRRASVAVPDSLSDARMAGLVKGFGCRPDASVRPGIGGPASESLRRTNPRESDERLIVYGDLARQRLWRGMFFGRSLRAESR